MLSDHLLTPVRVLWVLLPAYIANAGATLPRGFGPPLDFGRNFRDGRRIFGPSKTWSGFIGGILFAIPFGLLQAWLILLAPPSLAIVPQFGGSVWGSIPLVLLLTVGATSGDALGSFIKRRLGQPSGARMPFLDQLPFVVVPVLSGLLLFPAVFVSTFASWEAILWLLAFTFGLHAAFNWVGYWTGTKKVPW